MTGLALERLPFFVYGTLIPGQPNSHLWGEGIVKVSTAVFDGGCLYDMGYYPMLIEKRGVSVHGALVEVSEFSYAELLTRLDYLEGFLPENPDLSTYRRLKRGVKTAGGKVKKAWLYAGWAELVNGQPQIPDGDWVRYSTGIKEQMDDWWSSIRTVQGTGNQRAKDDK